MALALWIILGLLAALGWAFSNIFDKILQTKYLKNYVALSGVSGIGGFLISLSFLPFIDFFIPSIGIIIMALLVGVLNVLAIMPFFKAIQFEEVSRVVPLWHFIPLLVLVIAFFFLGEFLKPIQLIAFLILLIGSFFLTIRKVEGVFTFSKAFWLMILSSLLYSFVTVGSRHLYTSQPLWNTFMWIKVGNLLAGIVLIIYAWKGLTEVKKTNWTTLLAFLFIAEFTGTAAFAVEAIAIVQTPAIALLTVIESAAQPFFVLAIAVVVSIWKPHHLKEELHGKTILIKVGALIIMAVGVYLLTV